MNNLEKQIREAARIEAGLNPDFDWDEENYYQPNKIAIYESYLEGVKSDVAKALHTKGMYSEEDMIAFSIWCGENYVCYHSDREGKKIWFDPSRVKYYTTERLLEDWSDKHKKR